MTGTLGVGVAGCGAIARHVHLPALRAIRGATVTALVDEDEATLAAAARLAPHAARFGTLGEMLGSGLVDAVVVCTSSASHAALAESVVEAGRALYLEKPIATSLDDGRRLAAAASRSDTVAVTGFNRRFHPLFDDLRRIVAGGSIGRCRLVRTAFCEPTDPERMPAWKRRRDTGGGVLLDLASHHLDLLRWLTGEEILSVEASVVSERSEQDSARLRLVLSGEVAAETFVSFRAARTDSVEVVGDRGVARADRYGRSLVATVTSTRSHSARRIRRLPSAATARLHAQALLRPAAEPSYRACLAAFTRATGGARVPALASIEDGLRSLEAVLAAERSAMHGGRPERP